MRATILYDIAWGKKELYTEYIQAKWKKQFDRQTKTKQSAGHNINSVPKLLGNSLYQTHVD